MNKINSKGQIICGFAGIGKSYAAKNLVNWVDLESTPFLKDWETYVRVAKHMSDNGYNVMLSCHKDLRQKLMDNNIDFLTIFPKSTIKGTAIDSKSVYIHRYQDRGNTQQFIDLMSNNWGEFQTKLPYESVYELPLNEYLIDYITKN